VHHVEQRGRALHLVDHDDVTAGVCREHLPKPLWARQEDPERGERA